MTVVAEIGAGGLILLGVLVVLVPAVGYALYSRKGSGISPRRRQARRVFAHGQAEQSGGGEARRSTMDPTRHRVTVRPR